MVPRTNARDLRCERRPSKRHAETTWWKHRLSAGRYLLMPLIQIPLSCLWGVLLTHCVLFHEVWMERRKRKTTGYLICGRFLRCEGRGKRSCWRAWRGWLWEVKARKRKKKNWRQKHGGRDRGEEWQLKRLIVPPGGVGTGVPLLQTKTQERQQLSTTPRAHMRADLAGEHTMPTSLWPCRACEAPPALLVRTTVFEWRSYVLGSDKSKQKSAPSSPVHVLLQNLHLSANAGSPVPQPSTVSEKWMLLFSSTNMNQDLRESTISAELGMPQLYTSAIT